MRERSDISANFVISKSPMSNILFFFLAGLVKFKKRFCLGADYYRERETCYFNIGKRVTCFSLGALIFPTHTIDLEVSILTDLYFRG